MVLVWVLELRLVVVSSSPPRLRCGRRLHEHTCVRQVDVAQGQATSVLQSCLILRGACLTGEKKNFNPTEKNPLCDMNLDRHFGGDAPKMFPKFFHSQKKWSKHPNEIICGANTDCLAALEFQIPRQFITAAELARELGSTIFRSCCMNFLLCFPCTSSVSRPSCGMNPLTTFMTAMVKSHDGPRFFAESCPTA